MEHFIGIALKNIFRQKKRSFTLGVNYAIVTLILTLLFAFSQGAKVNIFNSLTKASAGHITITGRFAKDGRIYGGIQRTSEILSIVDKTLGAEVTVLPRYQVQSALYFGGLSKRLSFVGVDTDKDATIREQLTFTEGNWEAYAEDPNGLIVPAATAEYFGFVEGDEVVVSSRTRFGAFNTGIMKIRGIYTSDNFFAQGSMYTHFEFLRALDLAEADASTSLYIYFPKLDDVAGKRDALSTGLLSAGFEPSNPKDSSEAIAAVSAASTKYEEDKEGRDRVMLKLTTIDEALGIVGTVLMAVNAVGALIAAVMLFVIAVSIFINLKMSINERLREIGTMRAMGVESGGVTSLFVFESLLLALIFSAIGAGIAIMISAIFRFLIVLPSGGNLGLFLDSGHLVLIPRIVDVAAIIAIIAFFSTVFSYFPARRGGKIPPVVALTKLF
ncbi:MAG: FtsX-like permease family protein [Rectinemataceae bacterium]|nr:FtsX-like permease family protein [Rectinemataceae bacterium]